MKHRRTRPVQTRRGFLRLGMRVLISGCMAALVLNWFRKRKTCPYPEDARPMICSDCPRIGRCTSHPAPSGERSD